MTDRTRPSTGRLGSSHRRIVAIGLVSTHMSLMRIAIIKCRMDKSDQQSSQPSVTDLHTDRVRPDGLAR